MYESVSRVTGPWRAAFPENSHQDTLAGPGAPAHLLTLATRSPAAHSREVQSWVEILDRGCTCACTCDRLCHYTLTPLGAGLRLQAGWNIFFLFPRLGGLGGLGGAMGGKGVCHYTLTPLGPGLRL